MQGKREAFVDRLENISDPLPQVALFSLPGRRQLLAAISGTHVRIRLRPGFGGNDFAPVLQGELVEDSGSTVLTGRFEIDRHIRVFMRLWLSGLQYLDSSSS